MTDEKKDPVADELLIMRNWWKKLNKMDLPAAMRVLTYLKDRLTGKEEKEEGEE